MNARYTALIGVLLLSVSGCGGGVEEVSEEVESTQPRGDPTIDLRSFRLGSIAVFAEMVGVGVKELALSAPMEPQEMDALLAEAERLAEEQGVELYREVDFLVTDLFSEELTAGKQVLLIYQGDTAEKYLKLKADKKILEQQGMYDGEARREIATRLGVLLSYPNAKIASLLEGKG